MKKLPFRVITRIVLITLSILALSLQAVQASVLTSVFINEIHYDNSGGDTGEGVEIAGPAGTDLAGWSIVLYNGSTGASYNTIALSGVFTDEQGGYGTAVFPAVGMQNGSPDGLALVDSGGAVLQFLSYEGSFVAIDGPANGMASIDIGVSEASTTPIGESLQLMGTGTYYEDFAWSVPVANTFDSPNSGQTFLGGQQQVVLVINEILQNPSAVSDGNGEWFEIYNPGSSPVDINGWTIADADFDSHIINNGGPLLVPAGGFLVLGNNLDSGTNGGVTVAYSYAGDMFLSNSGDELILIDASQTEIDRVEYDGGPGFPDPNGASMSLVDPALDNNVAANWCESSTPFGAGDMGTPGSANICPDPNEVIINEILQNPSAVADGNGEWFEIYNPGSSPVDIDGWTIADAGADSHVINNGGPLLVPAGGFLVLGNNLDPGTNGGVAVAYDYGALFLSNGDDELILIDANQTEIDRVEYDGGPGFPDPTGASMSLIDSSLDNNVAANWCESTTPFGAGDLGTPGAENSCETPVPLVLIHDIQGSGLASAMDGDKVAIEGIVVGDFQDGASGTNGDLNGFYVQEEDADADADASTSEGIFVYEGNSPAVDVKLGDLVRVEGTVDEFFTLTELTSVTLVNVISSGNPLPTLTDVTLPVTSLDDFERIEGMYVTFPQDLVITEIFDFDRYNQVALASVRANNATADYEPGPDAIQATADYFLDRIVLDDGRTIQNPDPALHPDGTTFDLSNLFRSGDSLGSVTGIMEFTFGEYRIQPTQGAIHTESNPRAATPDDVGGNLKVASFNVLNYFTTLDEGDNVCGPLASGCRGADNAEEFTRQRDKIISALLTLDADIVGIIEIENHAGDVPTADLVSGLNAIAGAGTWDFIPTGAFGDQPIRQALIYKPAKATPDGAFAILDSSVDPTFNDDRNRPVLAQTFRDDATGGRFTAAVAHLKSKGADCNDQNDPDTGDGSGNCNLTRTAAAQAIVTWLATDPTGSGDDDFLILGDLNAYDREDPIDALLAGGYTDLVDTFVGNSAYSFFFTGTGYLDYALANTNLIGEVTGATIWNINSDEPDLIDYNMDAKKDPQDAIYAVDPYRASDHDPVLLGLDLVPVANLSITKTDNADTVVPGELVTYDIMVSNTGPDADPAAVVTDTFADSLTCTYTSVAAGGATGNTAAGSGDLSETLALPAGSKVTYTAVCAIDPATQNGVLVNAAEVTTSAFDPNLNDNRMEDSSNLVRQSDILISAVVSKDVVIAGTELMFTVTVTNDGPSNAANIIITDQLPPFTTFVSATASAGGNCTTPATGATGTVACVWPGDTPPSGTHSLDLVVMVDSSAPNGALIEETAVSGSNSQDPDATVNSTTVSATVVTEAYWNVTMFWTDGGEDSMNVTLTCDGIDPVSTVVDPGVMTTLTATGWVNGSTSCVLTEEQPAGVGIEYSIDCSVDNVVSNTTYTCEIYNTSFVGIPTLDRSGLALLVLLMLSVGLVGFRRFS